MLVNGTVPVGAARVAEVPADAALEETLAAFTRELPVVLAAGLVPAHHALDVLLLLLLLALALLAALVGLRGRAGRAPLARRLRGVRGARRGSRHRGRLRRLRSLRAGHIVLRVSPRANYHCHIYGTPWPNCSPPVAFGCQRIRFFRGLSPQLFS